MSVSHVNDNRDLYLYPLFDSLFDFYWITTRCMYVSAMRTSLFRLDDILIDRNNRETRIIDEEMMQRVKQHGEFIIVSRATTSRDYTI